MNRYLSLFCSGLIGLASVGMVAPSQAAPMAPISAAVPANIIKVQADSGSQWRDGPIYRRGDGPRRDWRRDGPRRDWRGDRPRRDWRRDGPRRHWRGDRRYRPHYGSGVIIDLGPRYYEPRRVYRAPRGSAHVNWCYARYKTYRAWDNTFVLNSYGDRRQCYSPYSR